MFETINLNFPFLLLFRVKLIMAPRTDQSKVTSLLHAIPAWLILQYVSDH